MGSGTRRKGCDVVDYKDFEYKLKGLEEGYWRAIGYKDTKTIRDAADLMWSTLHDLADKIERGKQPK